MAVMLPVKSDCSLLSSPCTVSSSDSKRESAQRWVPGPQFGKRRRASQENEPAELSCKAVALGNIQGPMAVTISVCLITNSET